ncbi:Uncharacterised protein [Chlamydia trachomatis]|nr:Uncharacterised protein [Chlamydia trachomatis]
MFLAKSAMMLLKSPVKFLLLTAFSTAIFGSVIVPVLSTQRTFTRAKVSTLFISCSITSCRANRIAARAKAIVVNKYSPSGIIPIKAASMEVILRLSPILFKKKL